MKEFVAVKGQGATGIFMARDEDHAKSLYPDADFVFAIIEEEPTILGAWGHQEDGS